MTVAEKAVKVNAGIPLERAPAIVNAFFDQIESENGAYNRVGYRNGMAVVWNDNEGYYIYQTETMIVVTR